MTYQNMSNASMLDLFRMEVEAQVEILNEKLLILENNPTAAKELESLMRAAHSIKGAARIVQIDAAVQIAHVMEDCFVAAQNNAIALATADQIDVLLQGADMLLRLSQVSSTDLETWRSTHQAEIVNLVAAISAIVTPQKSGFNSHTDTSIESLTPSNIPSPITSPPPQTNGQSITLIHQSQNSQLESLTPSNIPSPITSPPPQTTLVHQSPSIAVPPTVALQDKENHPSSQKSPSVDRVVRVNADNLNRIMGLAGESLVEANWLQPFADSLFKLRDHQINLCNLLEKLQQLLPDQSVNEHVKNYLTDSRSEANECHSILVERMVELELFARRSGNLCDRLYREVIASNMRPFADGVHGFPRLIRDLARKLGKQVKFEIIGKSTLVDRDILEKLEAPLTHILQNAIDHGIESDAKRQAVLKPAEGTVRLEAAHRAGMLSITVSDDGQGIDLKYLRQKIVSKGLTSAEIVEQLTEHELMEFLFLPGFSTKDTVTEISGRGVGLDVVQSMVQEVGGMVRAISQSGKGMSFHLQLPLTLSVIRTLLVEISGEPYAFPLTRIERIVRISNSDIAYIEDRQYFTLDEQNIGLVAANQLLELKESSLNTELFSVIIIADRLNRYGLAVDRFLGEQDLVVRPLNPRLGKVQNISAAALMPDGSPIIIVDIEDMLRSIDKLLNSSQLSKVTQKPSSATLKQRKRILVVDDSITVREVERKLLENHGYEVEVAVNGVDGWNVIRTENYDLIITDIDMPRMNGFELVSHIKNHPTLKSTPVIIVSYKDREADRIRGLEVGADYYLTKSSFHDDTLLNAVIDLIGE